MWGSEINYPNLSPSLLGKLEQSLFSQVGTYNIHAPDCERVLKNLAIKAYLPSANMHVFLLSQ